MLNGACRKPLGSRAKTLASLAKELCAKGEDTFLSLHRYPLLLVRSYPSIHPDSYDGITMGLDDGNGLVHSLPSDVNYPRLVSAIEIQKMSQQAITKKVTVGRSKANDIVIMASGVSRLHAMFILNREKNNYIVDAGSSNGTFINGVRLPKREKKPVLSGDQIAFNRHRFEFLEAKDFTRLLSKLFGIDLS